MSELRPLLEKSNRVWITSNRTSQRFRRLQSIDGIAVIPPTIEAADQLLYAESELEHVQRAFCRAVTTDPITVP